MDTDEATKAHERDMCADKVASIHTAIHELADTIVALEEDHQQMERVPEVEQRRLVELQEELVLHQGDCAGEESPAAPPLRPLPLIRLVCASESEMELFQKSQAHARAEAEQHKYAAMKEVIQEQVLEDAAEGVAITELLHHKAVNEKQRQQRKQHNAERKRQQQRQEVEEAQIHAAVQAEAGQAAAQGRLREATSKQQPTFDDISEQKKAIHSKRCNTHRRSQRT